jgi:hypothetical protein
MGDSEVKLEPDDEQNERLNHEHAAERDKPKLKNKQTNQPTSRHGGGS